jgi:O-antigen ligase
VLVPALGAVQGGFQPDAWVWSGALAAWAAALALVATDEPGMVRVHWRWLAVATALLVWTALSTVWSLRPSQSILEARRALLYTAVVLALLLLARRGATRTLALATWAATTGLLLYALVHYLVSARRPDPFEAYDLSRPIGYANGVGILAAGAILLAVGIADAEGGALGAVAATSVPPLALALTLAASNGSWLALGIGLAVSIVLRAQPQRFLGTAVAVALPTAAVVALGHYSRYAADVPTARIRGAVLLLAALAGGGAAAFAAFAARRLPDARTPRLRRAIVAGVVLLALGGVVAVAHAGSTEPRAAYWSVAWHDYTRHPALGSGAGTFGYAWVRSGKVLVYAGALDAHSLYVETLAELGPVGLLLVVALLLLPLRRVVRDRAVPYVATVAGAYCAFVIHAGLDWDWELPVVIVAALACGAGLLAGAPVPPERLRPRARAGFAVGALVLAGCAIAGARSHAVPAAQTARAPHRGALAQTVVERTGRYLP